METPREIKLENVDNVDQLKEYLNQFVDCYDKKLTMFLKVRSMILALKEKINEPENPPAENTIRVTDLLNNDIDKNLKQKYMKTNQNPSLLSERSYIDDCINALMTRFCNKGLDLSNFPIYKEKIPKSMFQTLLLEIMLNNFVTKKLIEKEESKDNSPATTVGDSPSKFSSTVSSVSTGSTGTEVMDYMMSPMSPVKKILFSTTTLDSNGKSLPLNRDEHIKGKIDNIDSDNYHKVYSASKFWSLFRDHYNENCNQLQGDLNNKVPAFDDTNTFYNQKVRNMQIVWKHVMLLKKRRQGLYQLLTEDDDAQTANKSLPKKINNFQDEPINESLPYTTVVTEPKPETLQNFMEQMSTAIEELNFPVAEDIKVETFMKIPEPPSPIPEPIPLLPAPLKTAPLPSIATEIVKILEEKIRNIDQRDPDTYFENIRKQHYLAMEILLQYKAKRQNISNEDLAQILELVDEKIYFVPQINVGGQETQDVYYYNNVAKYGIFDKKNVANNFLNPKKQSTQELTIEQKQEKLLELLELLDWMATNLHVFIGHYNLLRGNLEVIFKYIHDNKLKIFSEDGTYTSNTNEKLIVDYLKVFIEAIKDNIDSGEFNTLKSSVVDLDVDITETEEGGNIVIKEKLMDINGLLVKINRNINAICEEVVKTNNKGKTIKIKKDPAEEFNNITSIVKDLMCLKNKAESIQEQVQDTKQAQDVCSNIPGNIDEQQKNKLLDNIYNLFKKLIASKKCLDTIFEIAVTAGSRREKKDGRLYTLDKDESNRNLLKNLKVLFEYYKKQSPKKVEEITITGVDFETARKAIVIIGNDIIKADNRKYVEGKEMLFIKPIKITH